MSSGPFVLVSYRALYDPTQYHPIRVQPETLLLEIDGANGNVTNTAPTDPVTNPISAYVSGGVRNIGLIPRKVTIAFGDNPPAGYQPNGRITLPWLDPVTFVGIRRAQVGSYLQADITVVSTTQERVN